MLLFCSETIKNSQNNNTSVDFTTKIFYLFHNDFSLNFNKFNLINKSQVFLHNNNSSLEVGLNNKFYIEYKNKYNTKNQKIHLGFILKPRVKLKNIKEYICFYILLYTKLFHITWNSNENQFIKKCKPELKHLRFDLYNQTDIHKTFGFTLNVFKNNIIFLNISEISNSNKKDQTKLYYELHYIANNIAWFKIDNLSNIDISLIINGQKKTKNKISQLITIKFDFKDLNVNIYYNIVFKNSEKVFFGLYLKYLLQNKCNKKTYIGKITFICRIKKMIIFFGIYSNKIIFISFGFSHKEMFKNSEFYQTKIINTSEFIPIKIQPINNESNIKDTTNEIINT